MKRQGLGFSDCRNFLILNAELWLVLAGCAVQNLLARRLVKCNQKTYTKSMKKNRSHCPLNYSLEIFGDKWTLLIMRDLVFFKKKTYRELKNSSEKISTNILADRLKLLESEGIITKQVSPRDSKVFLYNLTQKGLDLIPVMLEIILWGAKYDPQTAAPPAIIKRIRNDRKTVMEEIIAAIKNPDAKILN